MGKSSWSEPMGGCDSAGNPITVSFGSVAWVSAADSPTVRRTTRSPKAPTMTTTDLATDPTTTALPVVSTPAPATNPVVLDMT